MSCDKKLTNIIYDNFMAYFKSHVYHLNIKGPDFSQYHSLLQEVYEALWDRHDGLNEQLRQMGYMCPVNLEVYIKDSLLSPSAPQKEPGEMFKVIISDLDSILKSAQILYDEAGNEGHGALETYIGDYMMCLSKLRWKLRSTLGM